MDWHLFLFGSLQYVLHWKYDAKWPWIYCCSSRLTLHQQKRFCASFGHPRTETRMLDNIVLRLASPMKKNFGWKKKNQKTILWVKKNFEFFSENKSCLKLPKLPRRQLGGSCYGQPDWRPHRVTCRVAPCSSKARLKAIERSEAWHKGCIGVGWRASKYNPVRRCWRKWRVRLLLTSPCMQP